MTGKGSKPRPLSIPRAEFADKWDQVFKRRKKEDDGKPGGKTKPVQRGDAGTCR